MDPASGLAGATRLLGVPGYEVMIAITPSGGMFIPTGIPTTGIFGVPYGTMPHLGEARIHASFDQGLTWEEKTPEDLMAVEREVIDNVVTVDPVTGRVFFAVFNSDHSGCLTLRWSDDDGESWTRNNLACGWEPSSHDHATVVTGVPRSGLPIIGYPNLVYLCANRVQGSECAVSRDGGQTFGAFVNVYPSLKPQEGPAGWCGGLASPVVTDSGGRVFWARPHCGVPSIAVSEDEGFTWTIHTISETRLSRSALAAGVSYIDTSDVQIAVDEEDNLYALWVGDDSLPRIATSRDQGRSWSEPWLVDAPDLVAASGHIGIDAMAPGKVAFAYVGTDHPGASESPRDFEGARWNLYLGISPNAFDAHPAIEVTLAHDADDPIGLDECGFSRCQVCEEGHACPGLYDYIDLELDSRGRPWAAFVDACHEECRESGEHDKAIATVGTLTRGPALTVAGGPLPPLSWTYEAGD